MKKMSVKNGFGMVRTPLVLISLVVILALITVVGLNYFNSSTGLASFSNETDYSYKPPASLEIKEGSFESPMIDDSMPRTELTVSERLDVLNDTLYQYPDMTKNISEEELAGITEIIKSEPVFSKENVLQLIASVAEPEPTEEELIQQELENERIRNSKETVGYEETFLINGKEYKESEIVNMTEEERQELRNQLAEEGTQ